MASTTIEVETAARKPRHAKLERWVEEVAHMCKPDRVHWCDGSPEEYQAMLRLMTLTGTAIPLDAAKRPNSLMMLLTVILGKLCGMASVTGTKRLRPDGQGSCASDSMHSLRRHPDRSRFSGGGKDLARRPNVSNYINSPSRRRPAAPASHSSPARVMELR